MSDRDIKANKKVSFFERLRRSLDIPVGALSNCSYIGISGTSELEISGCDGLEDYSSLKIVLRICGQFLTIDGEQLELCSFSNGDIRVNGQIKSLTFEKRFSSEEK